MFFFRSEPSFEGIAQMQRAAYVKGAGACAYLKRSKRALDARCHHLFAQCTRKEENSTDILCENQRREAPE